jgi:hypothetical protein
MWRLWCGSWRATSEGGPRTQNSAKLTAERSNRTAQESVGFCREAAIHHGPGLQPWVDVKRRFALKGRQYPSINRSTLSGFIKYGRLLAGRVKNQQPDEKAANNHFDHTACGQVNGLYLWRTGDSLAALSVGIYGLLVTVL